MPTIPAFMLFKAGAIILYFYHAGVWHSQKYFPE